jgi:hypothetical protein
MASDESSQVVCPCCSAQLDPLDADVVECPFCGWEFTINGADRVEEDGDIEGEAELEVNPDGELVEPDDDTTFPPWHGSASALLEQQGRGQRDAGDWIETDDEIWEHEYGDDWHLHHPRRGLCPSCAHPFRDVGLGQMFCPDCHCHFSLDSEQYLAEREDRQDWDWYGEDGLYDDGGEASGSARAPIIVCPQGQGDFCTVQEALDVAYQQRRPILLRPGVHESWRWTSDPVQILGAGPREEIIVQLEEDPLVVEHAQAVLRNLTLQRRGQPEGHNHPAIELCWGTVEECDITSDSAAGIRMVGGTLRRCSIHDCPQAGVLAQGGNIEECQVFANGGAGIVIDQGVALVSRCLIHDGRAEGVRVSPDGTAMLIDCVIHGNARSGVRVEGPRTELIRCRLHHNGTSGLLVARSGAAELRNSDVFDNARSGLRNNGGGLHVFGSRIHDGPGVGIITCGSAVTELRRCVICRNRGGAVRRRVRSRKAELCQCRLFANGPRRP